MAPTLVYFNGRGRCECIRLLLAAGEMEYEDKRIEQEDWPALKPNTPFGSLPVLEVDGKKLGQSLAIMKYLARELGMAGKSSVEQALVDSIAEQSTDIREKLVPIFFSPDGAEKEEKMKEYLEKTLPGMLDILEACIKRNKGGDSFLVGDKMTYADIQFFSVMDGLVTQHPSCLDKHPKLAALFKKVKANKGIAAWLEKRPDTPF